MNENMGIPKKPFLSPVLTGTNIIIPRTADVMTLFESNGGQSYAYVDYDLDITDPSGKVITLKNFNYNYPFTFTNNGVYAIRYYGKTSRAYETAYTTDPYSYTYYIAVVQNQYPLKKQTILDVVNRILRLAEPLVLDRNNLNYVKPPRFKFSYKYPEDTADGQAERALFAQVSPEFTFTRSTLREQLQKVGEFIHAEPRLIDKETWIFDRYGEQDLAQYARAIDGVIVPFNQHQYKGKFFSHDSGVACTNIESDVDNFVNRLDKIGGTITEPYRGGALTLRTDSAYGRLEDSEEILYFPTTRSIMDVTSMYWVDIEGLAGTAGEKYDITPYVFEKTAYDAELSSYDEAYPRSKSFAIYYTQGQKNINGFFFKNEEWSNGVFANYSIVNILERATGVSNLKDKLTDGKYPTLAFELTYTPMYGARVSHGKSYIGDMLKKPFALMYNQGSNIVETRYYGEHLKGVAERLGNVEKQVNLMVRNVGNIPKIGQMWDDDYYISTVKGSAVLDGIVLNIGLSKKFNRLSAYVGANSYKRYYEVSERMTQDRKMLYRDYLVITESAGGIIPDNCAIGDYYSCYGLLAVANTFYQAIGSIQWEGTGHSSNRATLEQEIVNMVQSTGYGKDFSPNTSIYLPVTSSSFGNCMEFTWDFKDNYSAGIASVYQKGSKTSGYFGAEVTYGDYYGRMYYQQWALGRKPYGQDITLSRALLLPNAFSNDDGGSYPITEVLGVSANSYNSLYHVVDKDSREILSQAYSIEFVTDMKGVIIGSALARNNPMIGGVLTDNKGNPCYAELYVLPNRVNAFSNDDLSLDGLEPVYQFLHLTTDPTYTFIKLVSNYAEGTKGEAYLQFDGISSPVAGKAWAIVTRRYSGEQETVENEEGESEEITPNYGGEILIARTIDVNEGDIVGKFNIVPAHDVFDFIKQEE